MNTHTETNTYTCICGIEYHHCAEIVQAGGTVTERDWQLTFVCNCGETISESELWKEGER